MSGSDPTVSVGGSESGHDIECPGQPFETVLGSPFPDIVATLEIGDELALVAVEHPTRGIAAVMADQTTVGYIVRNILHLRQCIARGSRYVGRVQEINGGSVTLWVSGV